MLVKFSQAENAEAPINVTEEGIFILVRLRQLENASLPIKVTE
jgi:hypothetical protein